MARRSSSDCDGVFVCLFVQIMFPIQSRNPPDLLFNTPPYLFSFLLVHSVLNVYVR